jgi:hypothetical protein
MHHEHWKVSDLPWSGFDPSRVDPELLKLVKAAAVVEYSGLRYSQYLCNVFSNDADFQKSARRWGLNEVQHGETLGRYASLADPSFDFTRAYARNIVGYSIDTDTTASIRGSLSGELVARCMVEIGTSSFYTAMGGATNEPLLQAICRNIATDKFQHYGMFYAYLKHYAAKEETSRLHRLKIMLARLFEAEDDELAYAYYAANARSDALYARENCIRAFELRALPLYSQEMIEQAVALMFKACGFRPYSFAQRMASRMAWKNLQSRIQKLRTLTSVKPARDSSLDRNAFSV